MFQKIYIALILILVLNISCSISKKFVDNEFFPDTELIELNNNLSKLGIISRVGVGASKNKNMALEKAKINAQMELYEYFKIKLESIKYEILKELGEYESYKEIEKSFEFISPRPDQRLLKILEQSVIVKSIIKYDAKTNVYTAGIVLGISNKKLCSFIFKRIANYWKDKYHQLIKTAAFKKARMDCEGYR